MIFVALFFLVIGAIAFLKGAMVWALIFGGCAVLCSLRS